MSDYAQHLADERQQGAYERAYWDKVDADLRSREHAGADRTLVFERDDGSQVLVTIYAVGAVELAERSDNSAIWGVPIEPLSDSARERP